jgi:hypothetical protein
MAVLPLNPAAPSVTSIPSVRLAANSRAEVGIDQVDANRDAGLVPSIACASGIRRSKKMDLKKCWAQIEAIGRQQQGDKQSGRAQQRDLFEKVDLHD